MNNWLHTLASWLEAGQPAVIVTAVRTDGSTPREAGATMLVGRAGTSDTIGGGHLEWLACAAAREVLLDGGVPRLMRFALGASLGQCCGGVVWLMLERVDPQEAAHWRTRAAAVAAGQTLQRRLVSGDEGSYWSLSAERPARGHATSFWSDGGHWQFEQQVTASRFPVLLFGAGHVGEAIARAMAPLGAQVSWVDGRDGVFPAEVPAGVFPVASEVPAAEVRAAPPGSYFLVLTHSHSLDFELCETILARQDFAYFGLIGSATKRASFEHRLVARGLDPLRLADLTCPIGIPGIRSKHPAAIAASVAAQLLQVKEARDAVARAARPVAITPFLLSGARP
jgi:xanthine dehydrogenase accessory factor